jgi:heme/copper-type cytochrome/quinol oxidase subunit 2
MQHKMNSVNLAADYGWGPNHLLYLLIIVIIVGAAGFLIVMLTSRMKNQTFTSKKKYHFERYWAIFVAAVLIYLWVSSYPWMPPVAFSSVTSGQQNQQQQEHSPQQQQMQVVNITAGQWFWLMNKYGSHTPFGQSPHVTVNVGQPVKFIARSIDVNHGFGIFAGPTDGSPILLQMQVIPGMDNVFYYTFKHPGIYLVRCLEYCGYAHPYMTSIIQVLPSGAGNTAFPSTGGSSPVVAGGGGAAGVGV